MLKQDDKQDSVVESKIRAFGVRAMAREVGVSPGMMCLFVEGGTFMSSEVVDKVLRKIRRIKLK